MNFAFKGSVNEFRDVICRGLGCGKQQPKARLLVMEVEGVDEPIPKGNMRVQLSKPIRPGFRRRVNLTPDEALDTRDDGSFAAIEAVEGDSTATVRPESTNKSVKLFVNGDGTLGTGKVVRVVADGHIGAGEAAISIEIAWDVADPDATEFNSAVQEEGPDEPIPPPVP